MTSPAAGDANEGQGLLAQAARALSPVQRNSPIGADVATSRRQSVDWAELASLAGAAEVRTMQRPTAGEEPASLWAHRTDPVRVVVNVDDLLTEAGYAELYYEDAEAELQRREDQLGIPTLIYVPDDPFYDEQAAALPPATAEQHAARDRLYELRDQLEAQRVRDWTAYGDAFRANVLTAAAELMPGLPAPVEVVVYLELQDGHGGAYDRDSPEEVLLSYARLATPLPGSDVPYRAYPITQSVYEVERAAGRLPLTRLEAARTNDQEA